MSPEQAERRLAAILFSDIVGYTALMAQSEEVGLRLRERHRAVFAPVARRYRGEVVDENGDELVLAFSSAVDAVNCALAVQAELRDEPELQLRIGIHSGDVVFDGGRVYGDGVNVASRIRPLAEPGGVCVSEPVYDSVKNQPNVSATSLGPQRLKNVARPMEAFTVEGTAGPAPAGPMGEGRGTGRPRRRLRTALVATVGTASVMAFALWASWPRPLGLLVVLAGLGGLPVDPQLPDKPSIAVLPFSNMSGDPEQEYFSDGITEDLTTALAGNPYLFVISRNSAFTYKGSAVKVEDVGRELGVRYVLEGSVRKAGDRVRITAQLIDATTGGHLWSQRYDRDLSDIFALQSEMSEEILGSVGVEIGAAEAQRLARKSTESLTTADAVWKGIFHMNQGTPNDHEEARLLLERAIELDPNSATAQGLLGIAHGTRRANGWSSDPDLIDRAEELGRRAVELDPSDPHGHLAIAWANLLRGKSAEAIAAAERSIERGPNQEWAHAVRGLALAQNGRLLEATRSLRRALRLNPRAPSGLLATVAFVNYGAGRREEAVEMWERVREASPEFIVARIPLAAHYEREEKHDRASTIVEEILRVRADFTVQDAIDMTPGLERGLGSEEFAQFKEALLNAGLPAIATPTSPGPGLPALPTGPTVAVLPFTNMSGDPEQEYFSDGLSEDIITKLSRFKDLFVIARNSTFRYKGQAVDIRDVARALGARYVLERSVRRAGTSLRVTAQLLDASGGTHLWAETYDRDLSTSSIFAVQDEITEQVVATIAGDGVISRARFADVEGKAPETLAAYECVLLAQAPGRDLALQPDREKVRRCLERAVRDDPGYTDAWERLAWSYMMEHTFGQPGDPEALDRAFRAAQRAVDSDPTDQGALYALASTHFHRHELDRFVAVFDRAIALNPNNAVLVADGGGRFIFAGQGERGIALTRRAAALDPQQPGWIHHNFAAYHFERKEYGEALAAAQKTRFEGNFWNRIYLAASYGQLGRQDEARTAVEELLSLYPGFTLQTASLELRKWNFPSEAIGRYVEGLRRAGVPEEPGD